MIGGTAPLEGALTGARTILLNPYSMRDGNHAVYEQSDILFDTIDDAGRAIAAFRAGERPGFGNWATVLEHFDPYRDGRAGHRVRAVLDYLVRQAPTKTHDAAVADNVRAVVAAAAVPRAVAAEPCRV